MLPTILFIIRSSRFLRNAHGLPHVFSPWKTAILTGLWPRSRSSERPTEFQTSPLAWARDDFYTESRILFARRAYPTLASPKYFEFIQKVSAYFSMEVIQRQTRMLIPNPIHPSTPTPPSERRAGGEMALTPQYFSEPHE